MVGELYMRVDSRISANSRLTFIVFSAIIVLLTLFYCYWVGWKGYVGEAEMYNFGYADAIFNGIAPFTPFEDLRWEYPPLAYLLFLPPRLFASDPQSYVFAFAVEVAVFCIIGLWIMMRIARSMGRNYTGVLLTYVISIFILNYFIFDRFDIIVAVIALGAVSMFMEKRY